MDICHLQTSELEPRYRKYKDGVVLRGDIVKDDAGLYAGFTEQGSSASQMTAAKVMVIISSQDVQGKQQMQYPLKLRSKWKMHQRCWKFQSQSVQIFGYVYRSTHGQNHGPVWKTQSFLLSEICMVILWQDYYGKGNLRKSYWTTVGRRFPIGNVSLCIIKKDYSYLCMWMTEKLAGKIQNLVPMWKLLNKEVDLGEPTCFLGYVRIQDFCWSQGKTTYQSFKETWCRNIIFLVPWHGRSRKEMCGKILRTCE